MLNAEDIDIIEEFITSIDNDPVDIFINNLYEGHIKRLKKLLEAYKNSIPKEKIRKIFDIKINNFDYLSGTDWCSEMKYIDKRIAKILKIILDELLEEEK